MNKFMKSSVLVIPVIVLAVFVGGCSSGFTSQPEPGGSASSGAVSQVPTNGRVQSNDGGRVTIDIEWLRAENDSLVFNVAMNTHSVDLDQYDLGELAVLRDDTGNEYHPVSWDSTPGGHHRSGTLTFSLPDSLSQGKARYVEMVIRDIAGIEKRLLKWEL